MFLVKIASKGTSLSGLIKETTCNVMADHLQSRVMRWHQYASYVKVRGTLLKMVNQLLENFHINFTIKSP